MSHKWKYNLTKSRVRGYSYVMKIISKFLTIISFLFFISCEEDSEALLETPPSIINTSISYFEGAIKKNELLSVNGVDAWKIQLENSKGSVLNIFWRVQSSQLLKMEGIKAPFNYDLNPGNNLINLSTAKTIATGQAQETTLLRWSLELADIAKNTWTYYFEFKNSPNTTFPVYVNATNGEILMLN